MSLPGPTATADRAPGPDLARGVMLLFIALANTHYFLPAAEVRGGYPQDGTVVDRVVIWLLSTFVDGRAFPMFGLLFGYGVAQIVRRQRPRGAAGVRHLLWRRSAVLIVVGLADALLFYVGDILAAYGVLLVIGAWMVRWKDSWLLGAATVFFVITALPSGDASTISLAGPDVSMLPPDPATMIASRLPVAAVVALLGPLGFLCPFAIGLWAGRRRLLERPSRLLAVVAVSGLGAAVLGAQPIALWLSGVSGLPNPEPAAALHSATGTLGGLGYAALFALAGWRSRSIIALGQRSMTFYLAQSVTWAIVFTPFLLDLSGRLTVTTTALLATAAWAATVLIAGRMRRRGPFETLVRRVTYRAWPRAQSRALSATASQPGSAQVQCERPGNS
ncbi:DUF418 domain-containing protein [Actinoplanes sp. NPDC051861]|uniref:DUF418 domain-containing protein n=1 Tax=Actinoplanes sp. NPDC051861 TaxID=3155170 RepID=UPI00341F6023